MKTTKNEKHSIGIYTENDPGFVKKIAAVCESLHWKPSEAAKNCAIVGMEVLHAQGIEGFLGLLNKSSDL